jgi:hypothetical protein
MKADPVVAEVRKIREDLCSRFDNDPARFINFLQELAEQWEQEKFAYSRYPELSVDAGALREEPRPRERDPVIDEIRRVREKIWDECGGDIRRYGARLQKLEEELRKSGKYQFVTLSDLEKAKSADRPEESK